MVLRLRLRILALEALDLGLVLNVLTDVGITGSLAHTSSLLGLAALAISGLGLTGLLRGAETLGGKARRCCADDEGELVHGAGPLGRRSEMVLDRERKLGNEGNNAADDSLGNDHRGLLLGKERLELGHDLAKAERGAGPIERLRTIGDEGIGRIVHRLGINDSEGRERAEVLRHDEEGADDPVAGLPEACVVLLSRGARGRNVNIEGADDIAEAGIEVAELGLGDREVTEESSTAEEKRFGAVEGSVLTWRSTDKPELAQ